MTVRCNKMKRTSS